MRNTRGQNRQAVYYNRGASDKQALEEGDAVLLQPFKLDHKDWSILKETVEQISKPLAYVFNMLLKKGSRNKSVNYRPVSLTSGSFHVK